MMHEFAFFFESGDHELNHVAGHRARADLITVYVIFPVLAPFS
jgi:hypothetical protein